MNLLTLNATRGRGKYYSLTLLAFALLSSLALKDLNQKTDQLIFQRFHNSTLIVIAHPDDETMFFGPTILSLINRQKDVKLLCLSSGNADGFGTQRVQELNHVAATLGEKATLDIVDDISLVDGLGEDWSIGVVKSYMESQIKKYRPFIKQVITFDEIGISHHPNHKSLFHALQTVVNDSGYSDINFFVLESVSVWRKYTTFLDAFGTIATNHLLGWPSSRITISIDFKQYKTLRKILSLHSSQMVWFRQLYMIFSRYMFINDLRQLNRD